MSGLISPLEHRYRVWLVRCDCWRPGGWNDMPPEAVAVEEGDIGSMSADEAAHFVRGFNETMLLARRQLWAIPVAVVIRYEGDLSPGHSVESSMIAHEVLASPD